MLGSQQSNLAIKYIYNSHQSIFPETPGSAIKRVAPSGEYYPRPVECTVGLQVYEIVCKYGLINEVHQMLDTGNVGSHMFIV